MACLVVALEGVAQVGKGQKKEKEEEEEALGEENKQTLCNWSRRNRTWKRRRESIR